MTSAMSRYRGVVPVLVTPCSAAGKIDPEATARLCRLVTERQCEGVLVSGSTGEMPFLGAEQRRSLTRAARSGLGTRGMLYAGITGLGVEETIRYAQWAADDGADVAVLMAPLFLKISQEQLYAYSCAVAEASPLPVALYHHGRAATAFEVETITRLARHPKIIAMKDTSQDMARFRSLLAATADNDFAMFQGDESCMRASFEAGAAGCVSALAGIMPEWYVRLAAAAQARESDVAAGIQENIDGLVEMFRLPAVGKSISNFALSVKLGLRARGWLEHVDDILPGLEPDPAFEAAVLQILQRRGVRP